MSLFEDIFPDKMDVSKLPPPTEHAKSLLDRADNPEIRTRLANLAVPPLLEHALSMTMSNRWEDAKYIFEFALAIATESGDWRLQLHVMAHVGTAFTEAGWYSEASVTFMIMRTLAHDHAEKERESDAISHLAVICHKQGLHDHALALMTEALNVDRSPSHLGMLAQILNDAGKFEEATPYLREAIEGSRKRGDFVNEAMGHAHLGRCHAELGRLVQAEGEFRRAMEGIQQILQHIHGYEERALLMDKLQDVFEEYTVTLMTLRSIDSADDRSAEGFRVTEVGRASSLLESLRARTSSGVTLPVTIQQLQDTLDDRTVVLNYVLCAKASYVWSISKACSEVHQLPKKTEILSDVARLLTSITQSKPDWSRLARGLKHTLINPVRPLIERTLNNLPNEQAGRLVICSDYWMTVLPFEVLLGPLQEEEQTTFLLNRCGVSYITSASMIAVLQNIKASMSTTWRNNVLAFAPVAFSSAPDLPNTEPELSGIAASFNSHASVGQRKADLKLGHEASKDAVLKAQLADYRYIHFATHGHLDEKGGYFCGLLMAGQNQGPDEVLHAYEVAHLNMPCDLVTASACDTAIGRAFRGEGMMSLAHAFLKAGAPSACVSLWKVSDQSTVQLMHDFYANLSNGTCDKAEALRRAKLNLIQRGRWDHPFYWASFILFGHWG